MTKTANQVSASLGAAAVLIAGVWLGLRAGYSQFAAVSFGLLPALLFLYPVVRERSGGEMTFARWLGTLLFVAFIAASFHNIIRRFLYY